jgi:hypothetical protein
MIDRRNGVDGKICSTCRQWKPLSAYHDDRTSPPSQGGKHCRCKECHEKDAAKRRARSREIKAVTGSG